MKYVGITGFQGAGKSSLAEALHELDPDHTVIRPFAAPLKALASAIYEVDLSLFNHWKAKDQVLNGLQLSPRALLHKLSEELKAKYGERIILDLYQKGIDTLPEDTIVVIPDVRLKIEVDWLRGRAGSIVAIQGINSLRYKQKNYMDTCLDADITIYSSKLETGQIAPDLLQAAALHIKEMRVI